MSDLHLALFAVAALLLLALYLSEKWKERRLLRRLRDRLHGGVGDALLGAGTTDLRGPAPISDASTVPVRSRSGRIEPSLGIHVPESVETAPPTHALDEQGRPVPQGVAPLGVAEPQVMSEVLRAPTALLGPDWTEDPLLDCSLEIRCARAVDGVSVIDAAAVLAHTTWRLPVHFVVWDGRHQQWVLPDRFGYYTDALASIQLADRHGRIEEAELIRFVQVVQQVANTLDADVDSPDTQKLLEQAQELDRLCVRFDMKIGLTVESSGATWTGPQMRSAAQQANFVATNGQRWVHYDSQGDALYTLEADTVSMKRLMLEFDIAVAPIGANGFGSMVESATTLAAILGGRVVDDNGDPIEAKSLATVQTQLARLYEEMLGAGIEPGSVRARRLYV